MISAFASCQNKEGTPLFFRAQKYGFFSNGEQKLY